MLELIGLQRLHIGPISLRVEAGQCVSIMGASGTGKSLLLRAIADLDPHDGHAELDGVAASAGAAPEWRARVTYVAADSGWWATRVADHFLPGTDFSTLQEMGISAEAGAWPVSRLSTGERQRLALLRALRPHTRVLLLDEPTSGLDADNVRRVETWLTAAMTRGLAVVLVTHDPAQADRLASSQWTLRGGRLEPRSA